MNKQITQNQNIWLEKYEPLVKSIAKQLLTRLPQTVQFDDLVQAGMIGLLECKAKYSKDKGASFETYASIRVRGAMLDEVRRVDWAPRSVRKNSRNISSAIKLLENQHGREVRDHEIAKELDINLNEYHKMLQDTYTAKTFGFEDFNEKEETGFGTMLSNNEGNPFDTLASHDSKAKLADLISTLPEKEKLVIALYYAEELKLKEVGKVLGVSESRVCQIHAQATLRLQARAGDFI